MRDSTTAAIIVAMTRHLTASRVLLVTDRREVASELRSAPLRRFRLARLRIDGRVSAARYEPLKRADA
jgi:hypothetical protein